MSEYSFTLVMTGLGELGYDVSEAQSAEDAIASAVRQVESVSPLTVHHVEPGEYVSLGLIAQRLGRSRESIRQLAVGLRGPGGFPTPVSGVADRTRLWCWSEVVSWWERTFSHQLDPAIAELARAIKRFNAKRCDRPLQSA